MKKFVSVSMLGVILAVSFLAFGFHEDDSDEKLAIEAVVTNSYFNGAFNKLNTEVMRKGFHPDFAIFSANGNELARYPIDTWIKNIEKNKDSAKYRENAQYDCKIVNIDVTGGSAGVKVELSQNSKLVYTDYLSLLKFDNGWKIAAKVYHRHN